MNPKLRQHMDKIFIFHTHNTHHRRKIYESFASSITRTSFEQLCNEITEYDGIVIDNSENHQTLFKFKFSYNAKKIQKCWRNYINRQKMSAALIRLKMCNELIHLPGVGIRYFEAMEDFNSRSLSFTFKN
jgi:hypothetical protein